MKKTFIQAATLLVALACLVALSVPAVSQDKPLDMKKLIADIIGDYEFSAEGRTLIVQFTEVDGKLFGAPPGETPEEIHLVAGKPLCFDVTTAEDGEYYELQFVRNDKGVIDKCIMMTGGYTIEGVKIIK